jgi:RimJ/RimL family protein N-acetyltransferase
MDIRTPLFNGERVCLGPIDHEKDPPVESRWTHDPGYLRLMSLEPARPLSPEQVKKKYETIEKEVDESKNQFYFTIRSREDERLIGFARLFWINWPQGSGHLKLGIGDPQDRSQGYGSEALQLLLGFAFDELNLHRLTATVPETNQPALHLFHKSGFSEEVRNRQAVNRDGKRCDLLGLGLLRQEWAAQAAR